jgi:hypothetical protein
MTAGRSGDAGVGRKAEASTNILAICSGSTRLGNAWGIGRATEVGSGRKQLGSDRRR